MDQKVLERLTLLSMSTRGMIDNSRVGQSTSGGANKGSDEITEAPIVNNTLVAW